MKLKNNLYFTTKSGIRVNIIGLMAVDSAFFYLYIHDDYNTLNINGIDSYNNLKYHRHILFSKLQTNNPIIGAAYYGSVRIVASLDAKQIMNKFMQNDI